MNQLTDQSATCRSADRSRRLGVALVICIVSLAVVGCAANPPYNQGASGGRMDPSADSPAEYGTLELRSQDLVTATDQMARDIAMTIHAPEWQIPPRILVGHIENRTSQPHQQYQIFLNRLRAQLLASGSAHGLDVRRERQFVEQQRDREFAGRDPLNTAAAYRSEVEYVLTCIVQDMPRRGTNYFLLEYQLVQIVDRAQSGPERGPGAIVWSNFYEVKFN